MENLKYIIEIQLVLSLIIIVNSIHDKDRVRKTFSLLSATFSFLVAFGVFFVEV